MCHCGNTKRGSAFALSLQGIVHMEISQVSRNDRFAAQIVYRAIAPSGAEADFCGGAECDSAGGGWLAECAARTAKQPQGPAPAYVPFS